ncbi:MAG: inositol monophosphatase [Planctomycetes bacterium]|nr:inositol monophosphatase [Planctomycetota bacterium]
MAEDRLIEGLAALQDAIRDRVLAARAGRPSEELARVVREEVDDQIFEIDRIAEQDLLALVERCCHGFGRLKVTAEGLAEEAVLATGGPGRHHLILDPVDGSRLLAWDKRSAFVLSGLAPDRGDEETLEDIFLAVQTEIPTTRSHLADRLVARKGGGCLGTTLDLDRGTTTDFRPRSSAAPTAAGGFGSVLRYFAPGRELLARIDDRLVAAALPGPRPRLFEDPYLATGGIFHQIATGRDRFAADLRPRVAAVLEARGETPPLCSHPYDLATHLIAREAGAIVTSDRGGPLRQPLDRSGRVGYLVWANENIRAALEPLLLAIAAEVLGEG